MLCSKFLYKNNHPKCKWIEFTNQKKLNDWMDKKTRPNYILPIRDSLKI